ncbi:MAG: hypothetical protein STHCBS139747_005112 [Sporothrix thermara]
MTSMLRKKEHVTIITAIPGFIPRQLAIDILHSHSEVITLNPLVLEHKPIKAPRDAASDEYYSTWYEIIERIQYVPGIGRMGSGKLAFNACFHDMPWGLQAHIYAPMNTDLRYKYRICGNQPGIEPPETLEMGLAALGAPSDGLYLREDVEVKCSIAVMSFVKSQLKAASKLMVQRIIKKAELIDAGQLRAMLENGRLKTINPADRSTALNPGTASASAAAAAGNNASSITPTSPVPSPSPVLPANSHDQQEQDTKTQGSPQSRTETPGSPPPVPYQVPRPLSMQPQSNTAGLQMPYGGRPSSAGVAQPQTPYQPPGSPGLSMYTPYPGYPNSTPYPGYPGQAGYAIPPGGGYYPPPPPPQQQQQQQQQQQYPQNYQMYPAMYAPYGPGQLPPPPQFYAELQAPYQPLAAPPNQPAAANTFAFEMPGDYYHAAPSQQPPSQQQVSSATSTPRTNRDSEILANGQWSTPVAQQQQQQQQTGSRPNSMGSNLSGTSASQAGAAAGYRSPGLDKSFASELETHLETPDEHRREVLKKLDPSATPAALHIRHHSVQH